MTLDYSALLYDPVYDRLGVPAVIGTANITVIDDTRPKTNVSGSGEILSVGPGAFARMPELTENGIAREGLVDSVLTFNGRSWKVLATEPRGSPNGEDVGELRLLLKEHAGNGGGGGGGFASSSVSSRSISGGAI